MRTIGVVTTARADYGIYRPLLRRIQAEPDLKLELYVSGMHLAPQYGSTIHLIEADQFDISERFEVLLASDSPTSIGKAMGLGLLSFADFFGRHKPDILVVLGDRFEMSSAALAALPFKIAIAHLHGGELTQGAIDEALRHVITKLSHLHFVATEDFARRVIQLGEAPWRVTVSGALSLDNLHTIETLSPEMMQSRFNIAIDPDNPPLLVTFHPVTLDYENTEWHISELLKALERSGYPLIFTLPNADTAANTIRQHIQRFVAAHADAQIVENFGTEGYFNMMRYARAMLGNSSSGIIEAASFNLPVVNIGTRQSGRPHAENVIDTDYPHGAILAGLEEVLKRDLSALANPYGAGQAAEKMVNLLKSVSLDARLLQKEFHDLS